MDFTAASRAFRALGSVKFDSLWTASRQAPFFDALEIGKLPPADFRRQLRAALEVEADDAALDAAWSAMLGPPRQAALSLLAGLRNERKLFLLSNTNLIHLELLRQPMAVVCPGKRTCTNPTTRAILARVSRPCRPSKRCLRPTT